MIAALWALGLAHAEPLALRAPVDGAVVVAGMPQEGAAVWLRPQLGVGAGYDVRGRTVDVAAAGRWDLTRAASGFGVQVGVAAGVPLTLAALRPAVEVAPWIGVGWERPRWHAVLDVAAPMAAAVGPTPNLRVPVVLEPWVGVTAGRFTVSAGAGMGQAWSPGQLPAMVLRYQLALAWQWERPVDGGGGAADPGR